MTEIENFLNKDTCKYLIDFFNKNLDKTIKFNLRHLIRLYDIKDDQNITNLINVYKSIRPKQKLENIELIMWPEGESHEWHDDATYYKYTTITYLNEDYEGGITHVEDYKVTPKIGKIILFNSNKQHMVSQLERGIRFVILAWYI